MAKKNSKDKNTDKTSCSFPIRSEESNDETIRNQGKAKSGAIRQRARSSRPFEYYLEHIKMTSFGKFANIIVGPFSSSMNVVYGPNEAGKTTLNELVKGVLFGWPTARSENNPYRPENAERSGSLFFKNVATGNVVELKRIKNSDDIQAPAPLLTNIDRKTYETMFSLTSDELLRLDKHSDITAHLLTAGSGTLSSPAHALEKIKAQIKLLTSRSSQVQDTIGALKEKQTNLRESIRLGKEEAQSLREQEHMLASLRPRRETMHDTQEQLNIEIESLNKAAAQIVSIDEQIASLEEKIELIQNQNSTHTEEEDLVLDNEISALADLDQMDEYRLRDALDDIDKHRAKLEHSADNAREEANSSRAEYELHVEDGSKQQQYTRAKKQRWIQLAFAIFVPVLMILIGLYIVSLPRQTMGTSYFMLGILIMLVALVLAAVGIIISLRPSKVEEEWEDERRKKQWVLQQDLKAYELSKRQLDDYVRTIENYLNEQGLSAALGSTRRARRILDRVHDLRSKRDLENQARRAQAVHLSTLKRDLRQARKTRSNLCMQMGLDESINVDEVDRLIKRKTDERSKVIQSIGQLDRRIGEISERLASARRNLSFDELKFQLAAVETRLSDACKDLAVLLIAARSLEDAITQWEHKSQPEVYRCASELLSQMTDGVWRTVRMNVQGDIEVVDAIKTVRPPYLLSLGTRQQLYLSLRIALLMTAENVGRGLPIMCDDILVNFDDMRRVQAIRALVELSKKRQVILFTCHSDIASLICENDSACKLIEL